MEGHQNNNTSRPTQRAYVQVCTEEIQYTVLHFLQRIK